MAPTAITPSSIRVRGVVCEWGERQAGRQTDRQTHRRPWPLYISPRLCLTRKV